MKMSYIFLSIGITGTTIITTLNIFAWIVLDNNTAMPFSSLWYSSWLPGYFAWLICLVLGTGFWVLDHKRMMS